MCIKRKVLIFVFILLVMFLPACSASTGSNREPVLEENTILRPTFYMRNTDFCAGTAFAVEMRDEKESLILTALHLFGPDGGLDEQIPSSELTNNIQKVEFTDVYTGDGCGECTQVLRIPGAEVGSGVNKDIAAFIYGDNINVPKLRIANKLPKRGEIVWLAASVITAPEDKMLHKAKVRSASNSMLIFVYEDEGINIRATSGAPILNSKGEVVGINVAAMDGGNKVIGAANPCTSIKKMLQDALE